ncbi:hypothetical protein [Phyllobacterium myrsinacearum]|uniref:Uncharacterized protein n=1 Tax=Phyllobacterium myrsinacearum TaxID=28101 RepID=A0A839F035_9HYPH|nr:hypothetical protein [Phyllobacterium myrsinacearum]MBA8882040.1 hypothetical protein [Phyllobacterium myrsinacearum]
MLTPTQLKAAVIVIVLIALCFGAYQLFAITKPVAALDDKPAVELTADQLIVRQRFLQNNIDAHLRAVTICAEGLKGTSDEDITNAAKKLGTQATNDLRDAVCSDMVDAFISGKKATCDVIGITCPEPR